ncbi:MAG: bifunctional hydroxymethylpyrimidine kinase/phosphomethylpyrimidine kinase [Alphaproteobacteria bacterium]|nr:bifunctional hydroxymethylpyrimidine kinase/phosphomethylpyrimidine kinase [Alphaproteobacteria bacterium]
MAETGKSAGKGPARADGKNGRERGTPQGATQGPPVPDPTVPQGRVLCVGRSDCLGRAGIQGDVRAIAHLGGQPATVVTMVSAEDGFNAFDWVEMPPTIIVRQIERVLRDLGVDCIKIGQLHSQEIIDVVTNTIERLVKDVPMVVAPVMVSIDGSPYHSVRAAAALKRRLLVHASVLAVSAREAEVLTGMQVRDPDAMLNAAAMLLTLGSRAVFVHGGHFGSETATDVLVTEDEVKTYDDGVPLADSVYGAKTAVSGAIAAGIAQGQSIVGAVERARAYLADSLAMLRVRNQAIQRRGHVGALALDGEEPVRLPHAALE